MIKYDGIKVQNKFYYLVFSNEFGNQISIPMDEKEAKRISLWIDKISTVKREIVERNNDEKSE